MKTSKNGINLIKYYEGSHTTAYICPAGKLTIGVGHTGLIGGFPIKKGQVINQDLVDKLLADDLVKFEKDVLTMVKVPLTQGQFDALVSFCFNLGAGALKSSTLLKLLNAKKYVEASAQFSKWINANGKPLNGLIKRRKSEQILFSTGSLKLI